MNESKPQSVLTGIYDDASNCAWVRVVTPIFYGVGSHYVVPMVMRNTNKEQEKQIENNTHNTLRDGVEMRLIPHICHMACRC